MEVLEVVWWRLSLYSSLGGVQKHPAVGTFDRTQV